MRKPSLQSYLANHNDKQPRRADPVRMGLQRHEYALLNAGDFVSAENVKPQQGQQTVLDVEEEDEDAEFSGSDDEERAEWERRRAARK